MQFDKEISLPGSAYEMGIEQGIRFREKIYEGWETVKFLSAKILKPPFLPMLLFLLIGGFRVKSFLNITFKNFPEFEERFNGIAHGAKISKRKLAIMHFIEVAGAHAAGRLMGCSSIAVIPPKSSEPMLAKNFDFDNEFEPFGILRKSMLHWEYSSIEFTLAPLAGSHTGMNNEGLAVTYNYGFSDEQLQRESLITAKVQYALQHCANVQEAITVLRKKPNPSAGIITVIDIYGGCAVVELSPDGTAIVEGSNSFLVNANLFEHQQMQQRMIPENAIYGENAPPKLRGVNIQESNIVRTTRLKELINSYDKIDVEHLKQILSDHSAAGEPSGNTICRHHECFGTHLSVIMLPARKKLFYTWGKPCEAEWREESI